MRKAIVMVMILAAALAAWGANPFQYMTNDQDLPAVAGIRELVERIERAERFGELTATRCRNEELRKSSSILQDPYGRTVKYVRAECEVGYCATYTHYYDNKKTLRHVLVEILSWQPDGQSEYRHYFDAGGRRIWSAEQLREGPESLVGKYRQVAGKAVRDPDQQFSRDCRAWENALWVP